jgi:DNA-binding LacI/PurR family transcriptional regulator
MDSVDVVELGIDALAARGCRRLALWSEIWSEPEHDRQEEKHVETRAFRRALAKHGLEFYSEWVRPQPREVVGPSSFDQAREWVNQIFNSPREGWPDGLIITNDILTRDVVAALQKFDILPNRDILIASHANTDSLVLRAYEDDLTLIEYDSGEIVQTMFDQLETLLRGEPVGNPQIIIRPRIRLQT